MSLWGNEFTIIKETPKAAKKIVDKVSKPINAKVMVEKQIKSKSLPLLERLKIITENVYKILGVYKDNTVTIKTKEQLLEYFEKIYINGIVAVDTETNNSLDPITCLLMGACIYTPGEKNAYIPLNHVDPITRQRFDWQLSENDIKEVFKTLKERNIKIIMHNGKFDYEVIHCTCNTDLDIFWDTMIGARILNENDRSAGLKQQYIQKIDPSIQKYSIEHLFEKVEYAVVNPEVFALYAATDAFMTYKLYEWQKKQFEKPEHYRLYQLFMNIEMPIVPVTAKMELQGISIDFEYSKRLSVKYHKQADEIDKEISVELNKLKSIIDKWRTTPEANQKPTKVNKNGETVEQKSPNEQLSDPPSVTSPLQLAILFYDILKIPPVDKKKPRGTGEDILLKIEQPLAKLILKKRGVEKLIGTYVDKIPACANPKTGRLHASFHSMGTDTGRFSSTEPNMQNIPSHAKDIRKLFTASPGCVFTSADYSQQEPRVLADFSADDNMKSSYLHGKDLYATIAAGVYNNKYEDNLEKHPDGTGNPDGTERRGNCKSILLGLMYGRGVTSIAEQIYGTIEDAQKIINDFYNNFPKVKKWMDESIEFAKTNGYVEDIYGRRRRLPDVQLPKYTIKYTNSQPTSDNFNPLLGSKGKVTSGKPNLITKYTELINKCRGWKESRSIKQQALQEGIIIIDNGSFISQAERQCVNSRIQGSSATITKLAMIYVDKDEILNNLGFKLLLCVHDELIGECPEENSDQVAKRLSQVMIDAAGEICSVPMKCDAEIMKSWYDNDYADVLYGEFEDRIAKGETKEEIFQDMLVKYSESTPEQLSKILFSDK